MPGQKIPGGDYIFSFLVSDEIPTLSRINLILLSVMMLITSLVAVRRYGS